MRIFGPKNNENKERRRLHNEELRSLYRSSNTGQNMRICSQNIRRSEYFKNVNTGKPTGKRPLGRPGRGIGFIRLRIGIIRGPF